MAKDTNISTIRGWWSQKGRTWFCTRLERWSIFCGDGMVMVIFSQRWNGDGFWKFLTITINGFWWDQPSATMVFRWFCNFWEPMVNNGHWRKNAYFATNSNSQQIPGKLKTIKSQTQHDSKILYCQFTQLTYPYAFKFAILKHVINIFFEILFDFCFS